MGSIKITLETLYDMLRNEKKRGELQELEPAFFIDVVSYVKEKKSLLTEKSASKDIFALGERDKLEYEVKSIQRILKEIYELREKKIIDVALNRSKTGSDIIDSSAMLIEEKEFYERILALFNLFREEVLYQLFKGQLPGTFSHARAKELALKENGLSKMEESQGMIAEDHGKIKGDQSKIEKGQGRAGEDQDKIWEGHNKTRIRFIHPTPSFIWKDMKVYGPFDSGEETEIFLEVAELLVRKNRAEKI